MTILKQPPAQEMEQARLRIEALIVRMVQPVGGEPPTEVCVAAIELARRMMHVEGRTVVQTYERLIDVITLMKASEETGLVIAETEVPS